MNGLFKSLCLVEDYIFCFHCWVFLFKQSERGYGAYGRDIKFEGERVNRWETSQISDFTIYTAYCVIL